MRAVVEERERDKPITRVLGERGGDRRSDKATADQGSRRTLKRGDNEEYAEGRLRRDAGKGDALAAAAVARVERGEVGWREAAHEAGVIERGPTLTELRRWWGKASAEERGSRRPGL